MEVRPVHIPLIFVRPGTYDVGQENRRLHLVEERLISGMERRANPELLRTFDNLCREKSKRFDGLGWVISEKWLTLRTVTKSCFCRPKWLNLMERWRRRYV
jgi:hypothetical protein